MTVRLSSKPYSLVSKHDGCRQDMEFDHVILRGPCSLKLEIRRPVDALQGF